MVAGYEELQCSNMRFLLPVLFTTFTASSTCPNVDIPQDKIIGFWVSETFFIKGKFTKSTDAILKNFTPKKFRKSTLCKSNGVEKISIFFDFAYLKISLCWLGVSFSLLNVSYKFSSKPIPINNGLLFLAITNLFLSLM